MIANSQTLINYFYEQRLNTMLQLYREKLSKAYYNTDKRWYNDNIMWLEKELNMLTLRQISEQ